MIISELNKLIDTPDRFVCMSRPRRFGKSYVGDLICAYYSRNCDTRHQFDGLKLSQDPSFEKYLNKIDVISIDVGGLYDRCYKEKENFITYISKLVTKELKEVFPDVELSDDSSISSSIKDIYSQTGHKFIIFIDEYDALVRQKVPQEQFDRYHHFLIGLFKNSTTQATIALGYVTGILPVIRDRVQSRLNVFEEFTFLDPAWFAEFMGFTEEETKALCERYNMNYEECIYWYGGYEFHNGTKVLSPLSVSRAMENGEYSDYWSQTSTFWVVLDAMKDSGHDFTDVIIRLLQGEHIHISVGSFQNTVTDFLFRDDVLTYTTLLGYLAYDANEKECYIPNAELRGQWQLIAQLYDNTKAVGELLKDSEKLLQATIKGDEEAVARGLEKAHDVLSSIKGYNDKNEFQAAITLAYYYAQNAYTLHKELPTGKGFADVVFIPKYPTLNYPAFVFELKVNRTTKTAMKQIEERKYGADMLHYRGNLMLVAVNYNTRNKKHTCQIKHFEVE